jgi:hypothetical protein
MVGTRNKITAALRLALVQGRCELFLAGFRSSPDRILVGISAYAKRLVDEIDLAIVKMLETRECLLQISRSGLQVLN